MDYWIPTVRFRLLLRSGNIKYTCLWPMFFILKGYDIMTSMYVLTLEFQIIFPRQLAIIRFFFH